MRHSRIIILSAFLLVCAFVSALIGIGVTHGQKQQDENPPAPRPRIVYPKPAKTKLTDQFQAGAIVLKFAEGTHVRLRSGLLTTDLANLTAAERKLLARTQLDDGTIIKELDFVNSLLQSMPKARVERMFHRTEEELAKEKETGEQNIGEELADPDLYYYVRLDEPKTEASEQLIDRLNALQVVEVAYAQPIPQPAQADIPPTTFRDFTNPDPSMGLPGQGHLNAAPTGIDARFAWTVPGGRGENSTVRDVESGWHGDHEDLPPLLEFGGHNAISQREHGTAVLGVIGARDNGYGVTGIAPLANLGVSSPVLIDGFYNVPAAIDDAASRSFAGSVMALPIHYPGPTGGLSCDSNCGNCGQFGYIAQEYWQADFDVIRRITAARGTIVVEAAGNGQMNLDDERYEGRFRRPNDDPRGRDSGAILVGAVNAGKRTLSCFSNRGSRVDLHAWGDSVVTTGYGGVPLGPPDPTFRFNGGDVRQWYTPGFGGTSSASPIVAGVVASLVSIRNAHGLPRLSSEQMRALLFNTASPNGPDAGPIRQPDLRAAIQAHGISVDCAGITPTFAYQSVNGVVAPEGFREFCFSAREGERFEFTTRGLADFDTIIELRNSAGALIVSNDNNCGTRSTLSVSPGYGDFRVRVRGAGRAGGQFTLAYRLSYTPPACEPLYIRGGWQLSLSAVGAGSRREYCFSITADARIDFEVFGAGWLPAIEVRNADSNFVLGSAVATSGTTARLSGWRTPYTGTFRLRVFDSGLGGGGNFRLNHRLTPGRIAGQVTRADGTPIGDARVQIRESCVINDIGIVTCTYAQTIADGYYRISDVAPGVYTLDVYADGFAPQTAIFSVNSGRITYADFIMR
ncbi:MAG: S8 family serine peptidase [Blastocatellia bacterium]